MKLRVLLLPLLALAAVSCGEEQADQGNALNAASAPEPALPAPPVAPPAAPSEPPAPPVRPEPVPEPSTRWQSSASGEGAALYLAHAHRGGERAVTLFCPARSGDLVVNVPGFRAIGSEERMTIGAGGTAVALVADTRGDRLRGGVTGTGPVPPELAAILRGELAISYGAQTSGPYAAPPDELARTFLAGCRG